MAQVKPFSYYEIESAPGIAGMKADTSVDVCDSFACEVGIDPGELVIRGTDPAKQVKPLTAVSDAGKVIGIALHDHIEPAAGAKYYPVGYAVGVMTFGDVYVVAGSDVVAGDTVAVVAAGTGVTAFVASTTASATALTGIKFMDSGAEGDIVRVRVRL